LSELSVMFNVILLNYTVYAVLMALILLNTCHGRSIQQNTTVHNTT
jgi:hypothetical protein